MESKNSKNSMAKMLEFESILKKNIDSYKKKSLKLNLNAINISHYKNNSLLFNKKKLLKKKIDHFKIKNKYPINFNTEFLKIKLKNKNKILSFKNSKDNNSSFYKYIYNNTESNNNLKNYTKNSSSFRSFNKVNTSSRPYSFSKLEKSILLHTSKEKNNNIMKINYINNYYLYKKEKPSLFIKMPPTNYSLYKKELNKTDIELIDKVDLKMFENNKLKRDIRMSLLQDINPEEKNYKLYLKYLKNIPNHVNFYEEIYIVPHIKNNFSFYKSVNNFEILKHKLCDKNFLHKKILFSMNRIRIIRELLVKQKEMERKKMLEEISEKPILKWKNFGETELSLYEQQFEKYELQDSFEKCTNYQIICFADKKLRNVIFSNKFH